MLYFLIPSQLISSQWDGVLGTADVIVTSESVAPAEISVHLVGGLRLSVTASALNPTVITATVTSHNTLNNYGQVSYQNFFGTFVLVVTVNTMIVSTVIRLGGLNLGSSLSE